MHRGGPGCLRCTQAGLRGPCARPHSAAPREWSPRRCARLPCPVPEKEGTSRVTGSGTRPPRRLSAHSYLETCARGQAPRGSDGAAAGRHWRLAGSGALWRALPLREPAGPQPGSTRGTAAAGSRSQSTERLAPVLQGSGAALHRSRRAARGCCRREPGGPRALLAAWASGGRVRARGSSVWPARLQPSSPATASGLAVTWHRPPSWCGGRKPSAATAIVLRREAWRGRRGAQPRDRDAPRRARGFPSAGRHAAGACARPSGPSMCAGSGSCRRTAFAKGAGLHASGHTCSRSLSFGALHPEARRKEMTAPREFRSSTSASLSDLAVVAGREPGRASGGSRPRGAPCPGLAQAPCHAGSTLWVL